MKYVVDVIGVLNRLFPSAIILKSREERESIERIVSRCSKDNGGSLYLGRYITREDVDERIKMLSSYDFVLQGFSRNV